MVRQVNFSISPWPGFRLVSNRRRRPGRMSLSQAILVFVVLAPGVVFGVLALLWLLGWVPGERMVSRITGVTFSASVLGLAALIWKIAFGVGNFAGGPLAASSSPVVVVTFGNWFAVDDYRFPLVADGGPLSLPFLAMTVSAFRTDRTVLGHLPPSRAWLLPIFLLAPPIRVRIVTRIRCRLIRSTRRWMGDCGHHIGTC